MRYQYNYIQTFLPQKSKVAFTGARLPRLDEVYNGKNLPSSKSRYFWMSTEYDDTRSIFMTAMTEGAEKVFSGDVPENQHPVKPVIEFRGHIDKGSVFIYRGHVFTVINDGLAMMNKSLGEHSFYDARKVIRDWFNGGKNGKKRIGRKTV